jgi:hypothetical protein
LHDASLNAASDALLPPAFTGLDIAVEQFLPNPAPVVPPNPTQVAAVFAVNYGESDDADGSGDLNVDLSHYATDPTLLLSPIFLGLEDALSPVVND